MNTVVHADDVISVIKEFVNCNAGDDATVNILLAVGSELLNVSTDKMLELLDEAK